MNKNEAMHFVNQYCSDYRGIRVVPMKLFGQWFSQLDLDGDGKIDMIEMAHVIDKLVD